VLTAAAPWRRFPCFATLAVGLAGFISTAQADLQVYEAFDYPSGETANLNGQGGSELGFAPSSTWVTFVDNSATGGFVQVHQQGATTGVLLNNATTNPYTNTIAKIPISGNFVGRNADPSGADHMEMYRELDPGVTSTFVAGNTTWFSYVSARAYNSLARSPSFAIGSGYLHSNRGQTANGPAIGVGGITYGGLPGSDSNSYGSLFYNQIWNQALGTDGNGSANFPSGPPYPTTIDGFMVGSAGYWKAPSPWTGTNPTTPEGVNITVGKIEWGDTTSTISSAVFYEDDTIDEVLFNTRSAGTAYTAPLDLTDFKYLSIGGGRFFVDELRIGTSFADVVGGGADPYAQWISGRGLAAGDAAVAADPDQDGLSNGLEFVLGSEPNPANVGATSLSDVLPAASQNSSRAMVFTFKRADISLGAASVTFQWSTDLSFPLANNVVVPASGTTTINDIEVTIADGSPKDTIVITVPAAKAAGGMLFGRIHTSVP
jgi:hypothetical protein